MSAYQILTDSGCDLSKETLAQLGVHTVSLTVNFRGETREDSVDEGIQEMYNGLRAGEPASTSAVNPAGWAAAMEPTLAAGEDLLVITFSSGLSTTYQSAVIAANELKETYPQREIFVVDSLSASLGQGLLVWYTCQKKNEGMGLAALAKWVENTRLHLCHWFTVDDLMYLKRGGRISATTALVGTMLNIKPIIHLNDEGKLINVAKVRGRKTAIEYIADKMGELGKDYENETCFVVHGDCQDDAQILADLIKEKYGVKNVHIGYLGPVIGAHTGPGVLSVFFMGEHR